MKIARLVSASCGFAAKPGLTPAARVAANRRILLECLERAVTFRPDFVCFPELFLQAGAGGFKAMAELAETIPGETFDRVSARAREMGAHVILPLFERDGGRVFNTAALIGRDGGLIGKYRKYHATGYEIEDGVTPGVEVPVWDTDRGRIGIAICFDLKYPVVGLELSRGRAQCVFFPTMFYGGQRLVSWAMDYGFHLVRCHGAGSRIVDPTGATVATEGQPEPLSEPGARVKWALAEINLDHRTYHLDFHSEKMAALQKKYGAGVSIRRMSEEGIFNLACQMPDRTVDDLEKEFELTPLRLYLDEAAAIRARALRTGSGGG